MLDLIPKLNDGVAVVTASPYHPSGGVNVPGWWRPVARAVVHVPAPVPSEALHLHELLSRLPASEAAHLELREKGFGVAEMLVQLDREGKTIVEQPAVLEVRLLGQSKMKLMRTISAAICGCSRG